MKNITLEKWLSLNDKERLDIQEKWNTNAGEGQEIVSQVYNLFMQKYSNLEEITITPPGIYHGGDWVIGVGLKIGYLVDLPERFLGIKIQKGVKGLTTELKLKLKNIYGGDVSRFLDKEAEIFSKYFTFVTIPLTSNARDYLIDFINKDIEN